MNTNNCSNWCKVDLHIHSKYSCESRATMDIETIFQKAEENDIKLISITDHNNVDGLDEIIETSKKYADKVAFLPGIEFKTDKGDKSVHAIAIFPQQVSKDTLSIDVNQEFIIQNILSPLELTKINITAAGSGLYETGLFNITVDFEKMADIVHQWGGLIIVHATKSNGIEQEMDHCHEANPTEDMLLNSLGTKKEDLMKNYIDICELTNWGGGQLKQQQFYVNRFSKPSVVFSDAHKADEIGKQFTWIKMDIPSFEGLRQVLYEPVLRIKLIEKLPKPNYQRLNCVTANGGYYKDIKFEFCPELNVLIGPRGSGKSVVIDLIKFVFGKYDPNDKESQILLHRLYELLRYKNTVKVEYVSKDGATTTFSRVLELEPDMKIPECLIDKSEPVPDEVSDNFEVYGQGELKNLLKRSEAKVKLLDEIEESFVEKDRINETFNKLQVNASRQMDISKEIIPLLELHNQEIEYRKTAEEIQQNLSGFDMSEYTTREDRNKYYELYLKKYDFIMNKLEEIRRSIENSFDIENTDDDIKNQFQAVFIKNHHEVLYDIDNIITKVLMQKDQYIENEMEGLGKWKNYYEEKHQEFVALLREKNIENVIDETNRLKMIKAKILDINTEYSRQLNTRIEELKTLQRDRQELIDKYHANLALLRTKRDARCKKINETTPDNTIRITLDDKQNKKALTDFLKIFFNGKGIRNLDDQIKIICDKTESIYSLIKLIRENNSSALVRALAITSNTASVLLSNVSDDIGICNYDNELIPVNESLFTLEKLAFEDIVHIEAYDLIAKKFKDIKRFSQGQQCSFLLTLLLASSRNTLVIDQPEDDLDWNYIKDFIDKLISLKIDEEGKGRQFIFATHNQNITVLADCEKIYYINNKTTEEDEDIPAGEIKASGGLDRIDVKAAVLSLEGGEEAFNLRRKKYGLK